LEAGSPCINIGNNVYVVGTTDLDGNSRIIDGTVDMGAYECLFDDFKILPYPGLTSTGYKEGPFSPTNKVYTVSNTGSSNLLWSANWNNVWVAISPSSGTVAGGGSTNATVSLTAAADLLAPGTYSDTVVFSNLTSGIAFYRDVELVVNEKMQLMPAEGLSSSGYEGGPFSPSNKVYAITNLGGGSSLSWVASWSNGWITVVPSNGTLAAGGSTNVTVSLTTAADSLPPGAHTNTVFFSNLTSGAFFSRDVQLVVNGTYYVDASRPDDLGSGFSWETAKKTIQGAIDTTSSGDTVLVSNGVYNIGGSATPGFSCMNRVVITKDIKVQSVTGPEHTVIVGEEASGGGNGSDAVRGVYMSAGVLSGFTVINGHTMKSGSDSNGNYDRSGGGINLYGGSGTVSNCVLMGNSASSYGGGSYYGTLTGCTLSGNEAYDGGGSARGTLHNCIISGNSASSYGGGSYFGTLNNCTLTGNSTDYRGGGSSFGTLHNCIVYFNTASYSGDNWYDSTVSYSCTTPDPGGNDNITDDPQFVDAANSNLYLQASSPCIDAGNNDYASGSTDLAGNPRIIDGTVDMGAYEFYEAQGDTDGDGLPDWWEEQYFSGATNANPNTLCSNGVNTLRQAYIAGLNPTNPASLFLTSVLRSPPSVLSWDAVSGRVYSVWWTSNLLSGDFLPLESNIPWTGNIFTDTTYGVEEKGFYKIDVELE